MAAVVLAKNTQQESVTGLLNMCDKEKLQYTTNDTFLFTYGNLQVATSRLWSQQHGQ